MQTNIEEKQAVEMAKHLAYADARGLHSHGCIRVKQYTKRLDAGGTNKKAEFTYKQTGPCTGVLDADNSTGFLAVTTGMNYAIELAQTNGLGVVGVKNMEHAGAMSYYLNMAAKQGLIAITMCQSDPLVVPYNSSEVYFGTNPFGFCAPQLDGPPIMLDMATSVQAWGKVMNAKNNNETIPLGWAIDNQGKPTTNPDNATALLPAAQAKGYGLAMMIDILSGVMLGLKFGKQVVHGFDNLNTPQGLGQFIMVINPTYFDNEDNFSTSIKEMVDQIHELKPIEGVDKVLVPGENSLLINQNYQKTGIPIPKNIYEYLIS